MIFDELSNLSKYSSIHPLFPLAIKFIQSQDLINLKIGRIDLEQHIYALVNQYESKSIEESFIECHKKFIDIQIMVCGNERIGVCNRKDCKVLEAYSEEKDFEKLDGPLDFITLRSNKFAIFFPNDAHMPGVTLDDNKSDIKKIVVKVPVLGNVS